MGKLFDASFKENLGSVVVATIVCVSLQAEVKNTVDLQTKSRTFSRSI